MISWLMRPNPRGLAYRGVYNSAGYRGKSPLHKNHPGCITINRPSNGRNGNSRKSKLLLSQNKEGLIGRIKFCLLHITKSVQLYTANCRS
jgi:hypothetical protein